MLPITTTHTGQRHAARRPGARSTPERRAHNNRRINDTQAPIFCIYRAVGVQPEDEQRWTKYLSSLLAFSAVSVLLLYAIMLLQVHLPEPWGHKGMTPALAFNTAISFTTKSRWHPGGAGTGLYGLVMMALLAVFIGGLMVGTTPEFLQKRLHARHMKLVSLYILAIPVTVLVGCAIAMALQGRRRTAALDQGHRSGMRLKAESVDSAAVSLRYPETKAERGAS